MASTAWKKPKYGMVRPVKQPKPKPPKKPSVLELKAIYKTIETATNMLHLDALSLAIVWYQSAIPYIKMKHPIESMTRAKLLVNALQCVMNAHKSNDNKEKELRLISALVAYRGYATIVISTPPVSPSLKKMHKYIGEQKTVAKTLNTRFDKLLGLLTQLFQSVNFEFVIAKDLFSITTRKAIDTRMDHAVSKMYISRDRAVKIQRQIRQVGLLPMAIDLAFDMSRVMSYAGTIEGKYIVNHARQLTNYQALMLDVVSFAANNPQAPKTIVKRKFDKKPKKSKQEKIEEPINADYDGQGE